MGYFRLYIRNNLKYRKSNYIMLFFSFFLAGLLICISFFYLTLERINGQSYSFPGFDAAITVNTSGDAELIENMYQKNQLMELQAKQRCSDLMLLYRDNIKETDENPVHSSLYIAYVSEQSAVDEILTENGSPMNALGRNEAYVSHYIYYYFQNDIENDVLTLRYIKNEDGSPVRLKIQGVINKELQKFTGLSVIVADRDLMERIRDACGSDAVRMFYQILDKENWRTALTSSSVKQLRTQVLSGWQIEEDNNIYSGDLAIAVFNGIFACLCIICSLKMKFDFEISDYRIADMLGLPIGKRVLLPLMDTVWIAFPAWIGSFITAALLFRWIAPYHIRTGSSSSIYSYYFSFSWEKCMQITAIYAGVFLTVLLLVIYIYFVRGGYVRYPTVKTSLRIFMESKRLLIPYLVHRFLRQKWSPIVFICLLWFPLLISAIYGTAAINLVTDARGMYGDADIIISRDNVNYGTEAAIRMAQTIKGLNGVSSVHIVNKTNQTYDIRTDTAVYQAELMAWSDYLETQFAPYAPNQELQQLMQTPQTVIMIDNANRYHEGETVYIHDRNTAWTIGAVLRNVPMEHRESAVLIDPLFLQELMGQTLPPAELHIRLDASIGADAYRDLTEKLSVVVDDPHAVITNQRENAAITLQNGHVIYDIASAMNVLIMIISVLSVVIYHYHSLLNRRYEFTLLHRIGYGKPQLCRMLFAEDILMLTMGIGLFVLLYLCYIGNVYEAIRQTQTYQYLNFAFAWREILVLSVGFVLVTVISDVIYMKKTKF